MHSFRYFRTSGKTLEWHLEEPQGLLLRGCHAFPTCKIPVFVDALGECDESLARKVVPIFGSLASVAVSAVSNLNICLSSCYYPNIRIQTRLDTCVEHQNGPDIVVIRGIQVTIQLSRRTTLQA